MQKYTERIPLKYGKMPQNICGYTDISTVYVGGATECRRKYRNPRHFGQTTGVPSVCRTVQPITLTLNLFERLPENFHREIMRHYRKSLFHIVVACSSDGTQSMDCQHIASSDMTYSVVCVSVCC